MRICYEVSFDVLERQLFILTLLFEDIRNSQAPQSTCDSSIAQVRQAGYLTVLLLAQSLLSKQFYKLLLILLTRK